MSSDRPPTDPPDGVGAIRNLISLNPKTVFEVITPEQYRDYCGLFTSPRNSKNIPSGIDAGVKWAADNDCFTGFQQKRFVNALARWGQYAGHCLFVNAPDVLLDASETLQSFQTWQPIIKDKKLPVAYTIQNGAHLLPIPWDDCDAIFIGANNTYKYSLHVAEIISEALRRGKWIHNGRTNTPNSIQYFLRLGVHSFDGSGYSIEPAKIKNHLIYQNQLLPTLFDNQWETIP